MIIFILIFILGLITGVMLMSLLQIHRNKEPQPYYSEQLNYEDYIPINVISKNGEERKFMFNVKNEPVEKISVENNTVFVEFKNGKRYKI